MTLITTIELVMLHWKDGQLTAMERKNGHLERHRVVPMTWQQSVDMFDAKSPDMNVSPRKLPPSTDMDS